MEFTFGDDANREFSLKLYPSGYKFEILNLKKCFLQSKFISNFLPKIRRWTSSQGLEPYHSRRDEKLLRTLTIQKNKRTDEMKIKLMTNPTTHAKLKNEKVEAKQTIHTF